MANYTKNLNLKKPLQTEFYNVDDFNENADIIDEKIGEAIDHHKDYANPHKVTAKQAGALYAEEFNKTTDDLNTVILSGLHCRFLRTTTNTLNTPYKQGITSNGTALVVSYAETVNNAVQIAFVSGHPQKLTFYRTMANGVISEWSTAYLPLSGGTLSGGVKINGGIGSFGAIEQYLSLAHVDEDTPSDYRNFTVSNPSDIIDSLYLHEVREGKEVAAYRIFGEHNKHLMGVSFIGSVGSYIGTGLSNGKSTVELNFDFPVKILLFGRRDFVPKGTGSAGTQSTEDVYIFEHSSPINVEAMLLNEYNGKAITTKAQINPDNTTPTTLMISANRKTVTITADNAHVGFNEKGGYYFYTAIG